MTFSYKNPKMIDYGLAFYESSRKPKVNLKRAIGTPGWWPPVSFNSCYSASGTFQNS